MHCAESSLCCCLEFTIDGDAEEVGVAGGSGIFEGGAGSEIFNPLTGTGLEL